MRRPARSGPTDPPWVLAPAVVLVVVVVLAGCGGLGGPSSGASPAPASPFDGSPTPGSSTGPPNGSTQTPTPTPTAAPTPTAVDVEAPTMNVTGGRLPVEPGRVYAITQRVLGTNFTTTPDVVVRDPAEIPFVAATPSKFYRLLGLTLDRRGVETAAYVRGPETVYVSERILNRTVLVETTLAHEYTHVVQHRTGAFDDLRTVGTSTDAEAVRSALIEGAAVYTADTYWQRHVRRNGRPVADLARVYRNASGATWFAVAQYRFGYRYVQARTDSPADLPRVYRTPPRTSEAVIHRLPPGAERPVNLTVNVTGESREWFELPSRTRMGELFVRSVLRTERPVGEAARGADGWGNDARLTFTGEDREENGYVWILRWDDAANATEFEDGFRSYLDGRATREDGLWRNGSAAYRYERIDTETVAVFVGPPGFVGNASATVSDAGTVTVRPPKR